MKQKEMAKNLGISKSYLSMIISGKRRANPELRERMSSLKVVNFRAGLSLRGRCPKPLDECATSKIERKSSQKFTTCLLGEFITSRPQGTSTRSITLDG